MTQERAARARALWGRAHSLLLRDGVIVRQIIYVQWEEPDKIVPIGTPVELRSGHVDNVQIRDSDDRVLWESSLEAAGVNTVSGRLHAGQLFYSFCMSSLSPEPKPAEMTQERAAQPQTGARRTLSDAAAGALDWREALERLVCLGRCPWCRHPIRDVSCCDEGLTWDCPEKCNP